MTENVDEYVFEVKPPTPEKKRKNPPRERDRHNDRDRDRDRDKDRDKYPPRGQPPSTSHLPREFTETLSGRALAYSDPNFRESSITSQILDKSSILSTPSYDINQNYSYSSRPQQHPTKPTSVALTQPLSYTKAYHHKPYISQPGSGSLEQPFLPSPSSFVPSSPGHPPFINLQESRTMSNESALPILPFFRSDSTPSASPPNSLHKYPLPTQHYSFSYTSNFSHPAQQTTQTSTTQQTERTHTLPPLSSILSALPARNDETPSPVQNNKFTKM